MKQTNKKFKSQKVKEVVYYKRFKLVLSSLYLARVILGNRNDLGDGTNPRERIYKSATVANTNFTYMMKAHANDRGLSPIVTVKASDGPQRLASFSKDDPLQLKYLTFPDLGSGNQLIGTYLSSEHILSFYEDQEDGKAYWSLNKVNSQNPLTFNTIQSKQAFPSQGTDSSFQIDTLPLLDDSSDDLLIFMGRGALELYTFRKNLDKIESLGKSASFSHSDPKYEIRSPIFVMVDEGIYIVGASGYKWSQEDPKSGYHLTLLMIDHSTESQHFSLKTMQNLKNFTYKDPEIIPHGIRY